MSGVALRALATLPGTTRLLGDERVEVEGVSSDSRTVEAGDLFAALPGRSVDGASYLTQAAARGARAVLSQRELACALPLLLVDDVRKRLGPLAQRVYGEPTRALRTIGVTGTNGKTTVSHLLESVLLYAGHKPALLGTVALRGPQGEQPAELTTPEADRLARFAAQSRAAGASHLLLEVSSVALAEERIGGMQFEVAAFTNLSHDHLDYHGTYDEYGEQKSRLFTEWAPATSVIVIDQPFGAQLAARAHGKVLRCSLRGAPAELSVRNFRSERSGIVAEVVTPAGALSLESPLFGAHNLENLLVTVGCALALGIDLADIAVALKTAKGAPGRMEAVANARGVLVLVDYAHTPDALVRALAALRPLTTGRLLVVFGCGGDRDRQKRAPMAQAAATGADIAVLTSDNPRSESLEQIFADMEPGAAAHARKVSIGELADAERGYVLIADRAQAIGAALAAARAGDTVLIAGKGHESYQIVGTTRHAFDDRVEAARLLAGSGAG
jgi:UDP-N-acetylmuramoyl-L-alanyl-D-glutamate--2,6-diaminopimelate ligase